MESMNTNSRRRWSPPKLPLTPTSIASHPNFDPTTVRTCKNHQALDTKAPDRAGGYYLTWMVSRGDTRRKDMRALNSCMFRLGKTGLSITLNKIALLMFFSYLLAAQIEATNRPRFLHVGGIALPL